MSFNTFFIILSALFVGVQMRAKPNKKPNIVFMLADDLGWNDIGIRNKAMKTPNLDKLAKDGITLNQSYVQNLCSPSRAALMTGYYPFKTGMQTLVIPNFAAMGVPLQFEMLPQKLQELGYSTHIIGKWHLGGCSKDYSPLNRGFDTFFGYNTGGQYYYDHSNPFLADADATRTDNVTNVYDFWNQNDVAWNYRGTYSSIPFVQQVKQVLQNWNREDPFFMYLAFQLTHSPLEVPNEQLKLYPREKNPARKRFSAMTSMLDSDVGKIIKLLKDNKAYDNSIIIFTADNGGEVRAGGNNWPLRGAKHTLYEGGHRATAFIHSRLLKKTGFAYNGMVHIVDWFPTLVSLAGGKPDPAMDGLDVWPAITSNQKSPRTRFVYHLENKGGTVRGAIRDGDWKMILGKAGLPSNAVLPKDVQGLFTNVPGGNVYFEDIPNYPPIRLFNLKNDPFENHNVAIDNPLIVAQLLLQAHQYKHQMVYPLFTGNNLTLYAENNPNLTYFGRDWCTPIQKATPINWKVEYQNDLIKFMG